MELGTYIELDGRPALRFVRTYRHSIDRVWAAVTDPQELPRWFPSAVEFDLRVGGTVTFSGDPHLAKSTGGILEYDPPRRLAFTWGNDELRFELESVGDACVFTLIDTLEQQNTAARNGAGWSICLGELDNALAEQPGEGPHSTASMELFYPYYEAYIAAGTPSGAKIPPLLAD